MGKYSTPIMDGDKYKMSTKTKSELTIFQVVNTALYRIKYSGGGELPEVLRGMYTSAVLAQKDIDKYKVVQMSKKNPYVEQRKADIRAEQLAKSEDKLVSNA